MTRRTYRYLENQLRLGPLALSQWVQFIVGAILLYALVKFVGIPAKPAISLGVFVIGIPTALAAASDEFDFSITNRIREAFSWRFGKRMYEVDGVISEHELLITEVDQ